MVLPSDVEAGLKTSNCIALPPPARRHWWDRNSHYGCTWDLEGRRQVSSLQRLRIGFPGIISKAEHVETHYQPSPDGFPVGTMSDADFCQYIFKAPQPIQDATICDLSWWRNDASSTLHQYLIITVAYKPYSTIDGPLTFYDIRVERIGKGMGLRGTAEQRITITPSQSLSSYLTPNTSLLFALLGAQPDSGAHSSLRTDSLPHSLRLIPCFKDPLDVKWRGPPANLRNLASYIHTIVHFAPRYSLASTNCYYFARVLTHLIALRHFSFSHLTSGEASTLQQRHVKHDPSSISIIFLFLHQEEKYNGVLLYRRVHKAISIVIKLSVLVLAVTGITYIPTDVGNKILCLAVGLCVGYALSLGLNLATQRMLVKRSRMTIREQTVAIIDIVDNDPNMTHPLARRGDYQFVSYLFKKEVKEQYSPDRYGGSFSAKYTVWVESPWPRDAVLPWPRMEQMYPVPTLRPVTPTKPNAAMQRDI